MAKGISRSKIAAFVFAALTLAFACMWAATAWADDNPDPFQYGVEVDLTDGDYSVDVVMEGGSGRASIDSPALLTVQGGHAAATIRWSSPNYDYMLVNDAKYIPVNEDPMANSEFQIPVLAFDEPFAVVGDTTAMSTPHEVDYTLAFALDSVVEGAPATMQPAQVGTEAQPDADTSADTSAPAAPAASAEGGISPWIVVGIIAVVLVVGIVIGVMRGRKNR